MPIYRLNPFECDPKFAFVSGAFPYDTALQFGGPVLAEMKEDGVDELDYEMDEDEGGLRVGDYVTNTDNHLIVTKQFCDAVCTDFHVGPHECVPARAINEKGRVHSHDLIVLNPLRAVDCLDLRNSEMNDDSARPMVRIFGKWSLDKSRIPADIDLFRVKGLGGYLFSQNLVDFIADRGFENFVFERAPLS